MPDSKCSAGADRRDSRVAGFACAGRIVRLLAAILLLVPAAGCHMTMAPRKTFSADRPSRHTISNRFFTLQTDFQLSANDPIVRELEDLQSQITSTLQLPDQRDPVVVYLFSDESTYRYYMQTTWSNLPPRRAYFVGTPRELAVYSFRSDQTEVDLRHEFTHGVLHACLGNVPLWLDEGLAEYFEVRGPTPGEPHREHLQELESASLEGWGPNLYQLESVHDFQFLTRRDYAESWAWVHFLLNSDSIAQETLLTYLQGLRSGNTPPRLQPTLEKSVPDYYESFKRHVAAHQKSPFNNLPATPDTPPAFDPIPQN